MKSSDIPDRFTIPWAENAGGSYIGSIPTTSQIGITDGAASLNDGFPPLCFVSPDSGGVPPLGRDFNGVLKWITLCLQWQQAGGPQVYSSSFSSAIGGYPENSIVASATTSGTIYISTADDNTTNPDTGGAGWQTLATLNNLVNIVYVGADTGTINVMAIAPDPSPSAYEDGQVFEVTPKYGNTTTNPTINVSGLGAKVIGHPNGSALVAGEIPANAKVLMAYDATLGMMVLLSPTLAYLAAKYLPLAGGTMTGPLILTGAPTADLEASTKKYVDDLGADVSAALAGYLPLLGGTMTGPLTLSGAPTAALHAATKAYAEGTWAKAAAGYQVFPSGLIIQWVTGSTMTPLEYSQTVTFPITFPTFCLFVLPGTSNTSADDNTDIWFQLVSKTTSNCVVFGQYDGSGINAGVAPLILAIGY